MRSPASTLIRHAASFSGPIGSLAIAVVQAAFPALLVTPVGCAKLSTTSLLPAGGATVSLSPIAGTADPKHYPIAPSTTESLTKNRLSMDRHPCSLAGLDKRPSIMAGYLYVWVR